MQVRSLKGVLVAAAITCALPENGQADSSSLTDPSPAAFETALMNEINKEHYNRQGLLTTMVEIGEFYCVLKQRGEMPWQSQMSEGRGWYDYALNNGKDYETEYIANLNDAILYAQAKWHAYRFPSDAAYRAYLDQLPSPTTELDMYTLAESDAEYHLCPGWPGHPVPPGLREDHRLD